MLLHAADLVNDGIQRIMIIAVGTDVVVIAISVIHKLDISSLWIAFGVGKNFRYIPVHEIAVQLGPSIQVSRPSILSCVYWLRPSVIIL